MSRVMLADLEKATKENKPLTFGAASYWATKLFRSPDHYEYDQDNKFKAAFKQVIEQSASIQKMKEECDYTAEQLQPYVNSIYSNIEYNKNSGLPIMLQAGLSILKSNENGMKQFAHHSRLTEEEAQKAVQLLTQKIEKEAIAPCSTRQYLKDSFSSDAAAKTKIQAARKVRSIFSVPDYDG